MNEFFESAAGAVIGYIRAACGDQIDAGNKEVQTKMRAAIILGLKDCALIEGLKIEDQIRRKVTESGLKMN
jgi:hypothetical protein